MLMLFRHIELDLFEFILPNRASASTFLCYSPLKFAACEAELSVVAGLVCVTIVTGLPVGQVKCGGTADLLVGQVGWSGPVPWVWNRRAGDVRG